MIFERIATKKKRTEKEKECRDIQGSIGYKQKKNH